MGILHFDRSIVLVNYPEATRQRNSCKRVCFSIIQTGKRNGDSQCVSIDTAEKGMLLVTKPTALSTSCIIPQRRKNFTFVPFQIIQRAAALYLGHFVNPILR